ncbi:replication initiator protein A-domain-containing protein, partial [Blyttiomyces helicus]
MADRAAQLATRYVRTHEAARILGISPRTLEKYRCHGSGPTFRKLGGRVVYAVDDLEAWADNERSKLDPFVVATGDASPRDQRDLMERPFFSLAKARRTAPIHYEAGDVRVEVYAVPEHGMATIWDADVLIWAASQIVEAENLGFKTSRFLRFTPYQLLTSIGRQTGARDYRLLKGALARLQSTVIRTTIRSGEHWRRHQFSWINEWEECTTRDGRVEGMEFVLPDWFYRGVIDRSLVLAIDPAYFRLTGGIERWLYRVARKHAGRQPKGWLFEIAHLHEKSGSL